MEISAGKLWGMRRLADVNGRIRVMAVDQQSSILARVAKSRGSELPYYDDVAEVTSVITRVFSAETTAVLLDPVWGYSEAWPDLRADRGLILSLEDDKYTDLPGGRRSRLLPDWSVAQAKRAGVDGVKFLVWYRPDALPDIRRHQQALVQAVGRACQRQDVPLTLRVAIHPFANPTEPGDTYGDDYARCLLHMLDGIKLFSDSTYGVDLFQIECPLAPAKVLGDGADQEMTACFTQLEEAAKRPWVIAANDTTDVGQFRQILTCACKAGASGFVIGQTLWGRSLEAFPDSGEMERRLVRDGLPQLSSLNAVVQEHGRSWVEAFSSPITLAHAGASFPAKYPTAAELHR